MEVKLCSSKINLKPTKFSDFVKQFSESEKVVKTASVKVAEKDEAETSGQPQAEAKLVNHPEKPKAGKATGTAKKESDEAETSGQPQAEAKLVNHPKVVAETVVETKTEEKPVETKVANTIKVARYVKISKLDAKTKTWLKAYWSNLYPVEYVDAMLAEK
jgi:hypothetical protein